jgi:hypothetical protein
LDGSNKEYIRKLENMWEGKVNIKGKTDIGEKLAFREKVWTVKEEMEYRRENY